MLHSLNIYKATPQNSIILFPSFPSKKNHKKTLFQNILIQDNPLIRCTRGNEMDTNAKISSCIQFPSSVLSLIRFYQLCSSSSLTVWVRNSATTLFRFRVEKSQYVWTLRTTDGIFYFIVIFSIIFIEQTRDIYKLIIRIYNNIDVFHKNNKYDERYCAACFSSQSINTRTTTPAKLIGFTILF